MYTAFFGLQEEPFSIAPDPRFLYMSDKHREALQLLGYGLTRGASFVLLTGEIGAGKTTVWRRFLEELPSNYDVASVVNPKLDTQALLTRVFEDLNVELPAADGRAVDLIDALHGHLLLAHAQGRRTLIVIDEAQALSNEVLEQLRLLTNLDSSGRKLQVMLIGQPELRQMMQQPQLEPLAQRVVARYHLPALSQSETAGYIAHRLAVAGLKGPMPFDGESLGLIHQICRGVPRRINVICDRAMSNAQAAGSRRVDRQAVERAADQVYGDKAATGPAPAEAPAAGGGVNPWAAAIVAVGALAAGAWLAPRFTLSPTSTVEPAASAASAMAASPMASPSLATSPTRAAATTAPPAAAKPTLVVPAASAPGQAPTPVAASPALAPSLARAAPPSPTSTPAPPPTAATPASTGTVPAPAFASIDDLFASGSNAAAADEAVAWRALARLWGVSLGAGDPCAAAAAQSLLCFRSRGGLAEVRQLDRPGLLRLADARGRVVHALLTAFDGAQATLAVGGVATVVPLGELARVWRGDFATFWRAPPGYREGDVASTAAGAAWLAERLAIADGQFGGPTGREALRPRVAAFQLAHGLTPDGVAGPLTLMRLARTGGSDEPRLARR